ncbi:hypothetical protein [Chryseobacterium sp. JV558]|uniref:hypothetical protein n=1 Tax=Chryseobacterium sp. JV558 TaxID=2663236 RepID=UPI00299D18C5|nr:hypothetical protein [Chryseobacterium sp. JV558]MDW9380317.1 hypothetical protein [Chryseobacterium sp. JV558]
MKNLLIYKLRFIFIYLFCTISICTVVQASVNKASLISVEPVFRQQNLKTTEIVNLINHYNDIFASETKMANWPNAAYDCAAFLYIPIQYGYDTKNQEIIKRLQVLFTYERLLTIKNRADIDDLSKRTFYFTVSEYLRRSGIRGDAEKTKMFNFIKKEILNYWNNAYANIWEAESRKFYGVKQRVEFLLTGEYNGDMSYYSAFTDLELYIMGTGVSLSLIEKDASLTATRDLINIKNSFYKVMQKKVVFQDNVWYLQPNVWKDHPNFQDVVLKKNQNVNWDASHFSRMPAYLHILKLAFQSDTTKFQYLDKLNTLLSRQLLNNIAMYNPKDGIYTFNNFVDGNNSNFRSNLKKGDKGLSPSEDYTHIFYGWWKMLNTNEVNMMYDKISLKYSYYSNQNPFINDNKGYFQEIVNLK